MAEYVGLDVSKEETSFCVVDEAGKILCQGKAESEPAALFNALRDSCLCPELVVLETGTLSKWLARGLRERGLTVEMIDARHAHAVMGLQLNKSDTSDAMLLAKIAQTGFYRSVPIGSVEAQERHAALKARKQLIKSVRSTENTVRGLLGSFGAKFPKGVGQFPVRVREALEEHPVLKPAIEPLLRVIEILRREVLSVSRHIATQAKTDSACRLLMTIPGVGALTAQAVVASIDDPARFSSSRKVGVYFGLTTRRYQSGEKDISGRISRTGDSMARALLYAAANSMIVHVDRDHPLKDWALRLKKRTGHRKACVALARKLSVIMHRMLKTGEPFRWPLTAAA
jgi:transposase